MRRIALLGTLLGLVVPTALAFAPGCGSDEAAPPATGGGSGGSSPTDAGIDAVGGTGGSGGTGATGGSGGAGGTGATGGTGGTGGPDAAPPDAAPDAPADVIEETICTAGSTRCVTNKLEKCSAAGTSWDSLLTCATSKLCDEVAGRCLAPECLPAEHRCNGVALERCNANQDGWDLVQNCTSPAHCRAEYKTCSATPCPVGSYQCSGSVLEVCNATQTDWTEVQDCQSSALCDAATKSCQPAACAKQEFDCVGSQLRMCNFTLDGWYDLEQCVSDALCDEPNGQCDLCEADRFQCDGAKLLHCSADGQSSALEETCATPSRCNAQVGRCDPACATGAPGAGLTCGTASDQDCCGKDAVPGGTFSRSYDEVNYTDPQYVATVSSFALDRYEVTVGRFREFLDAGFGTQAKPPQPGDGAHPTIAGSGWDATWDGLLPADTAALEAALSCDFTFQTWTGAADANEKKPINCVSWYEAFAFCAWAGGRLPTEAEWNYAATGGDEQRVFPWGEVLDYPHAVYGCEADLVPGCSSSDIFEVGSRSTAGDGRWQQADLAGNMSEWVLDKFLDPYPMPCSDCAAVTIGSGRMRRGGAWNEMNSSRLRSGARESANPEHRFTYLGFRCAWSP